MKILHCIHTIDRKAGGTTTFAEQLSAVQCQFNYEVEVASLDAPDDECVRQFPFKLHALGRGLSNYGFSSRWKEWLVGNAERFDIAMISGLWQYHSLGTWQVLKRQNKPYVVLPHGMLDRWFAEQYPLKHWKKTIYWKLAEYKVLRDARLVLFSSEDERLRAQNTFRPYAVREAVVGQAAEGLAGDPRLGQDEFFARFPQLRDKPFLLFMGRLHEKKGCDLLMMAFHRVAASYPAIQLVIGGPEDSDAATIRAQARSFGDGVSDRISFTGMLTGGARWGALSACQALALPSHQENFGRVVPEALSCGTPVLISNKVNIWREVQHAQAGLVADDSLEGTTKMVQDFFALSEHERRRMRENARRLFSERFSGEQFFPSFIATLREATEHGPGGF